MPKSLCDIVPHVAAHDLVAGLVPPPHFGNVSFDSYRPDPYYASQAAAVAGARAFVAVADQPKRRGWLRRGAPAEARPGIYFDGGFGVGKTHLLASI